MEENTEEIKQDNEISIRLISSLKSLGYDVENGDVPKLQKDLKYKRAQNIYNAISRKREPGLQLLVDLSNKFERFDLNYVVKGVKSDDKQTIQNKEGDDTNDKAASLNEMTALFEVLVDHLKGIRTNLYSSEAVIQQNNSLLQTILLNSARDKAKSIADAEKAFVGSLHVAKEFLKKNFSRTDVDITDHVNS